MIRKHLFSVVIPLYNKALYIKRALDSIFHQKFQDFEVVIVDDGSTDNSFEIVSKCYSDERLRVIRQSNAGPASARNTGVKYAVGEWVVFLDADDEFLPNAFEIFSSFISKHKDVSYFVFNYYLKDTISSQLFTNIRVDSRIKNPFLLEYLDILSGRPGSELVKKDLMINCPYDERLRRYEDAENQYRILNMAKVYQCSTPVLISHRDASEAADIRSDFNEDFLGHLSFEHKSFWERMQLYKLALEARIGYYDKAILLYDDIYDNKTYRRVNRGRKFLWDRLSVNVKYFIVRLINLT